MVSAQPHKTTPTNDWNTIHTAFHLSLSVDGIFWNPKVLGVLMIHQNGDGNLTPCLLVYMFPRCFREKHLGNKYSFLTTTYRLRNRVVSFVVHLHGASILSSFQREGRILWVFFWSFFSEPECDTNKLYINMSNYSCLPSNDMLLSTKNGFHVTKWWKQSCASKNGTGEQESDLFWRHVAPQPLGREMFVVE